jgi:hypothetical protein
MLRTVEGIDEEQNDDPSQEIRLKTDSRQLSDRRIQRSHAANTLQKNADSVVRENFRTKPSPAPAAWRTDHVLAVIV